MKWPCNAAAVIGLFALADLVLLGCATRKGLATPGIERVCTDRRCYLRSDADTVNARCTRGLRQWDSGKAFDPNGTTRARCCTVFAGKRYKIWVTEGQEACLAHEEGHIEIWEADGEVMIPAHHQRLDGFGLGREKKRL